MSNLKCSIEESPSEWCRRNRWNLPNIWQLFLLTHVLPRYSARRTVRTTRCYHPHIISAADLVVTDRCLQNAGPISVYVEHGKSFRMTKLTPCPTHFLGLSEWRSELLRMGLHHPASNLQGYFPEIDDTWAPVWFPSHNGENVEQPHNRMAGLMEAFLCEVWYRLPAEEHARILFISHAAPAVALHSKRSGAKIQARMYLFDRSNSRKGR